MADEQETSLKGSTSLAIHVRRQNVSRIVKPAGHHFAAERVWGYPYWVPLWNSTQGVVGLFLFHRAFSE
jgi:hypothetical protein